MFYLAFHGSLCLPSPRIFSKKLSTSASQMPGHQSASAMLLARKLQRTISYDLDLLGEQPVIDVLRQHGRVGMFLDVRTHLS